LLSLAGGANVAVAGLTANLAEQNIGASHKVTLTDEEITDVSLATFYVFDKETPAPSRFGLHVALGACGGCAGCGCGGCWTGTNYTTSVFGPQKPAHAPSHKHVPKNP
jgi:hypothetical protein